MGAIKDFKKTTSEEEMDKIIIQQFMNERKELKDKLYLTDIVDIEETKFTSNSLILAPVGSGKSTLIENRLIPKDYEGKIIYLVSNTTLKDSICPNDNKEREIRAKSGEGQKMFTTLNGNRFGDKPYNIHVMSYHEFGNKIWNRHEGFLNDVGIIFCDEIHSLPTYHSYDKDPALTMAMQYLFYKQPNKQIYYFTATMDNLNSYEKNNPKFFSDVTVYNFLEHPRIRKYIVNSTYWINHVEQIRPHLKAKLEGFNYYGYKGLAFSSRIKEQEKIAKIAIEEGYKPLVLWSVNNEKEMTKEQLKTRDFILRTGFIPNEYNLLIINNSMQEGWSLRDPDVRLAIMDTTDVTEQVQALGRIRGDTDLLICKTNDKLESTGKLEIPDDYINLLLSPELKSELCKKINVIDSKGRLTKWPTIKKMLISSGYVVEETQAYVNKKRRSCATISKP